MSESDKDFASGTRRLFVGAFVVAAILGAGITIWPFVTQNQTGTPKGGANPATASNTTTSPGAPAQRAGESTVGKNDPAGSGGGRPRAIKQSSATLQLSAEQRQKIKEIISQQSNPPKVQRAPFEMMIGTAVPNEVGLKDIPPEITQIMNGYWGDQYVLVQDELVIVDQHSHRVVAIVPAVA
jgi:Protein of unknown function (DUF1236)